ncbi:aquaporin [bacterium]|nr:aquaporin [bacterium]
MRRLIAEALGVFALVFVGIGAIASNESTGGALGLTGIALAHGLAIGVGVAATAAISGAHLNPAVSLALWMAGKFPQKDLLPYIIAQISGGIVGAFLATLVWSPEALTRIGHGAPALGGGVSMGQGVAMEIVLTFLLVSAVFGTAVHTKANSFTGGLFIGLAVVMGVLAGGAVSGAAMNPARHLGPALMSGNLSQTALYWIGPLLGAAIASALWSRILLKEEPPT